MGILQNTKWIPSKKNRQISEGRTCDDCTCFCRGSPADHTKPETFSLFCSLWCRLYSVNGRQCVEKITNAPLRTNRTGIEDACSTYWMTNALVSKNDPIPSRPRYLGVQKSTCCSHPCWGPVKIYDKKGKLNRSNTHKCKERPARGLVERSCILRRLFANTSCLTGSRR